MLICSSLYYTVLCCTIIYNTVLYCCIYFSPLIPYTHLPLSLSQILGNNECIEPYTSNMYVRRVRAGEFIVVNPHLLDDLVERGLWTKEVSDSRGYSHFIVFVSYFIFSSQAYPTFLLFNYLQAAIPSYMIININ